MGIFKTLFKIAVITAAIATGVGMLAASGTVGAATFSLGAISLSGAAAYFATSFVTSLVLGAASYALSKNASGQNALNGSMVSTRDAVAPHKIIYGRSRVGGTVVYLESTESNKYLHSVVALAGHEIDAVEKVYFNDVEVTWDANGLVDSGNYAGKARIKFKYGTPTQTAFEDLVAESDSNWTVDHRMKGIAAAYIRLEYDSNVFPNGMPATSFLIRGKKVYDPRTSTTAWSNNPALCVSDYLCDTKDGIGCVYADEIDEAALIVAANACEEQIPLAAGGYENKYEINGNFTTSTQPDQAINQMLTAMSGKAVWSSGKWRILAGIYSTPTLTFSEDDLRAGFAVQTLVSRRENFNGVKGVFPSSDNNYIASDFPPVISDYFITEDGGEEVIRNIQLPFTTSSSMAQRLAKIELLRARQQMTMTLPLKLNGLAVNVGDVIGVTNSRFGWDAKPFEVVSSSIAIGEALGVDLELRETASNVFDWDANEEAPFDVAPNTNLPNPTSITTPSGFGYNVFGSVADDGTYTVNVELYWTAIGDFMLDHYLLKAKLDGGTSWNSVTTKDNSYIVYNVPTGTYNIELSSFNFHGVESEVFSTSIVVASDTVAPSAPTGLTITSSGYQSAYLKWTNPADKDYYQTIIYASSTNDSDTAAEVGRISGTSITYSGLANDSTIYVWLKAIDYTGNISVFNTSRYSGTSFTTSGEITAPRNSTGFIYYKTASATAPSAPTASSYNFANSTFGSLTSTWTLTFTAPAPSTNPSSEAGSKFWAVRYTVVESSYGGSQTITLSSVFNWQNMDGLVTFTNVSSPSGTTFIDGGNIIANSLTVNKITSGTTSQINGGYFSLGDSTTLNGFLGAGGFETATNGRFALLAFHEGTTNTAGAIGASALGASGNSAIFSVASYNTSYNSFYTATALNTGSNAVNGRYNRSIGTANNMALNPVAWGTIGSADNGGYFANLGSTASNRVTDVFLANTTTTSAGVFRRYDTTGSTLQKEIYLSNGSYSAQSTLGAIYSADGYLPFTGVHDGLIEITEAPVVGDIVVDYQVQAVLDPSNIVMLYKKSSTANQKGVVGVCIQVFDTPPADWNEYEQTGEFDPITGNPIPNPEPVPNPMYYPVPAGQKVIHINAIGEGTINVTGEGGDIEIGDLIVSSSTAGKGMKQSDDIVRNITVAKSRENVTFSSANEIKQIACIYLAG